MLRGRVAHSTLYWLPELCLATALHPSYYHRRNWKTCKQYQPHTGYPPINELSDLIWLRLSFGGRTGRALCAHLRILAVRDRTDEAKCIHLPAHTSTFI